MGVERSECANTLREGSYSRRQSSGEGLADSRRSREAETPTAAKAASMRCSFDSQGGKARLTDTCLTGQDVFILALRQFGHTKLAEKLQGWDVERRNHSSTLPKFSVRVI